MVLMQYKNSYRLLTIKESPWLHSDQPLPDKFRDEQPDYVYKGDVFVHCGEVTTIHDFLDDDGEEEDTGETGGLHKILSKTEAIKDLAAAKA